MFDLHNILVTADGWPPAPHFPLVFLGGVLLVQVQLFGTCTMYGLKILHKCGKEIETKSQKNWSVVLFANPNRE